jgi:hypothetical protein
MKSRALVVASILLLAGCGGGGSGGATPQPHPTALPTNTPTSNYKNVASLTLTIPLKAKPGSDLRHPQYVSPSTTELVVNVNAVNGGAPPSWVTPNPQTVNLIVGTNCTTTSTTETCTVSTIPAPPGTVNYTFTVTDGTNALATFAGDKSIAQGTSNTLSVTLEGIVKTVSVSGATLNANTPLTGSGETLTVSAFDADGNLIVPPGNYNNPITLTDNDAISGVTSLSVNGVPGGVVNSPNDTVTLSYTGQAINGFTISPSGSGIACTGGCAIATAVNDVTFTTGSNPTDLDDAAHGGLNTDPNWDHQTVFFAQSSGSQIINAAELGFTNGPFSKLFSVDASACSGIATISAGPATSFTITASATGICKVKLSESGTGYPLGHPLVVAGSPTQNGTFWVSVTTGTFTVH